MDAKLENEYSGDEIWSHFAENAKKEELNPPPGYLKAEENEKGELVLLENGGAENAESIPEN